MNPRSRPTVRSQIFELLHVHRLTGAQIAEKLNKHYVPAILKDEGVCDRPRIKRETVPCVRGVVYSLTNLGEEDLEAAGRVDENAAGPSKGVHWPS
jgi:hypothetical protein